MTNSNTILRRGAALLLALTFALTAALPVFAEGAASSDTFYIDSVSQLLELAEKLGPEYCVAAVGLDEYQIRSLPEKSVLGIPRTGNLNDLCALYTAADLCVSLSHAETMGMTLVEALACGTQVLCWDVTAMPEIVTDEVGRTVPMGDFDGLAQAVRELCDQPKSPRDCRNRALEYAAPRRYRAYMRLYDGMYRNGPGYLQAVEEACRVRTEEDD